MDMYTVRILSVDSEVLGSTEAPNEPLAWREYESMEKFATESYRQAPMLGALHVQLITPEGVVLSESRIGS